MFLCLQKDGKGAAILGVQHDAAWFTARNTTSATVVCSQKERLEAAGETHFHCYFLMRKELEPHGLALIRNGSQRT